MVNNFYDLANDKQLIVTLLDQMIEWTKQHRSKQLLVLVLAGYFLFGIHYTHPNAGGHGLYLPFNIVGWIFISIIIGLGSWRIYRTGKIQLTSFSTYSLLASILLFLPLLYPNNELSSWSHHRLLGLLGGILFYLSLLQFKLSKQKGYYLFYFILCGVLIESILGVSQYYFFRPGNFMGYDVTANFPSGIFQQRNIMGIFMVTGCAISLFLIKNEKEHHYSKIKLFLLISVPFFASIILVAIKSKASFLGYFLSIATALFSSNLKDKWVQRWMIISALGFTFGMLSPKFFNKKFSERTLEASMGSNSVRIIFYKNSFNLFVDNPLLGKGYGSFRRKYREIDALRLSNEPDSKVKDPSTILDHPHNEILLWAAEGGILPVVGLLIIAGSYMIMIFRIKLKRSLSYLSLALPILLSTQVSLPFSLSLTHWVTFLSIIYLTDMEIGKSFIFNFKFHRLAIIPAIIVPLIVTTYMIQTLQTSKIFYEYELTEYRDHNLLFKAKRPEAWKMKYENYKLKALFDHGMRTKNNTTLQLFLDESEQFLQFAPFIHLYKSMETALYAMGEIDKANAVRKRAEYMYPTHYSLIYGKSN